MCFSVPSSGLVSRGAPCTGHGGGRVGVGAVWDTGAPVLWPSIPPYVLSHPAVCQPLCWGPRHPTASSQWLEVKAWGGKLVSPEGRGGDDSMHRTWCRQRRDVWVSSERDFHVGRQIAQERGLQELGPMHRADEGKAWEEQQQARALFQAVLSQKAARAEPSPHTTAPARPCHTCPAQAVPHKELSGPATGSGCCPALCPQGMVVGAPQAEGAAGAGWDPASVPLHHKCTCVNDPSPQSALPPRCLSSLSLLLWALTGDL